MSKDQAMRDPVACPFCKCDEIGFATGHSYTAELAADSDNSRATQTDLDEYQCKGCGAAFFC